MSYRTPEEVFEILLQAEYPPQLAPIVSESRAAGGFSNRLAGLIDRMQADDEFRKKIASEFDEGFKIGKLYGLSRHEVFALVAASSLVKPGAEQTSKPPVFMVGATADDLKVRFGRERLDFRLVRPEVVRLITDNLLNSKSLAAQIVGDPCTALGGFDVNRSEFVMLYIQAAIMRMINDNSSDLVVTPAFLEIANLSEHEVQTLCEQIWNARRT